ncbi:unnamed protein product [Parascedosporium putredinis]|uniref:Uncharacterized protein n=1 Tax=Parascedosporium putredinis TaxID=1442378 RepID=A0A9P1H953_9PEZI|nr:unnamed protein product [Parascedosporium putredinis]CAI8001509.1 unnamed protein product [Parascedosporium putredinis]
MNVPCSALAIVLIALAWPAEQDIAQRPQKIYSWGSIKQIDFFGSSTLLCACCFLVVAIQKGAETVGSRNEPYPIVAIVIATASGIALVAWELALRRGLFNSIKSIVPGSLFTNRAFTASFLVTLLTGRSPGTYRATDGPDMSPGRFLETTERSHAASSVAFATNMKIMVSVCGVMIFVSFFTLEKEPADISRLNTHHRSNCADPKYKSLSTFKAG